MIQITNIKCKGWRVKPNPEYKLYRMIEKIMRTEGFQGRMVTTTNRGSIIVGAKK